MIRVKLLKNIDLGEKGKIIQVSRNQAHTLIEEGVAVIFVENFYQDKMLRSNK